MRKGKILVVDDEKNIRLALQEALEPTGFEITTASSGEEALRALEEPRTALMLLDLQMPGIDGMEVLRQAAHAHPEVRVIIVTAHGTIDNAVEAMKLGAVDFIQKPFSVEEIRGLVTTVLDRNKLDAAKAASYAEHIELAKRCIGERRFDAAAEHVRRAIADDATRAEAFNLYGVLEELAGRRNEALTNYRIALHRDPAYKPAKENLMRATRPWEKRRGPLNL
jgi:DNA-binding NtrC family response regulator